MSDLARDLYAEAQLALAAYADLREGASFDRYVAALKLDGMGDAQARAFASGYRLIERYDGKVVRTRIDEFGQEQQTTLETGLSVTLFERLADGHRVVAVRGTEVTDLRDINNDILLLLGTFRVLPMPPLRRRCRSGSPVDSSHPDSR